LVGCSRHVVSHFFGGKGIDPQYFGTICELLELNLQEIVDTANSTDSHDVLVETNDDADILVKEVRKKIKPYIQERCGTMRVLDMT
jgi:hypothetical protein